MVKEKIPPVYGGIKGGERYRPGLLLSLSLVPMLQREYVILFQRRSVGTRELKESATR